MRSLLFNGMVPTALIILFSSCSFANLSKNTPVQLQNFYQSKADSDKRCLVTKGNDGEVALAKCGKQADASGLYLLEKSEGEYYTIHPVNNAEQCLRTFAGNQNVKIDACKENSATPANYPSMRYWKLIKTGELYNLENKYKYDIGSIYSCFSVAEHGDSVGVGECSITGSSPDFNNMRMWQLKY